MFIVGFLPFVNQDNLFQDVEALVNEKILQKVEALKAEVIMHEQALSKSVPNAEFR